MSENMVIQLEYTDEYEWLAFYKDYPCISAFGDTPSAAVKELQIARKGAEESYRKNGESIPWKVSDDQKLQQFEKEKSMSEDGGNKHKAICDCSEALHYELNGNLKVEIEKDGMKDILIVPNCHAILIIDNEEKQGE